MGKKGKGRKGKGKEESSESKVQETQQQQPGPSTQEAGRGRGRGRGQSPQGSAPRSPGIQPEKDAAAAADPVRELSEGVESLTIQEKVVPKGRGRGRGMSPEISKQKFPEFEQPKDVSEELSASPEVAPPSKDTSVRKKVLSKAEQESLLSQAVGMTLKHEAPTKFVMAKRPNYARIDERSRIRLYVNYFKLDYKDAVIYHYDIDISEADKQNKKGKSLMKEGRTEKEDKEKNVKFVERQKRRNIGKGKCRQIISKAFSTDSSLKKFCPVYDGQKNLFTSSPLPCKKGSSYPVDIEIEGKQKRFFVTISPVEKDDKTNQISLEPLKNLYSRRSNEIPYEVLLVYETVMNHREPPFEQVQFRNSFFSLKSNHSPLGCGFEVWFGYHQAVQLTELGPVVVINLAAKAFHKAGPVIDYANDVLERYDIRTVARLDRRQINSLTDALRGLTVKVTHQKNPRKYKIKSVTEQSAQELVLDIDGRRKSVAQYFLERYGKKLLYPNLPCLQMQTMSNTTFIPMETCEIADGQPKIGKLSADLTSKMIRNTAVAPKKRMDDIMKISSNVKEISKKYMGAFGLLMDIRLMKVDGRIITAPQLAYGGNDASRIAKPDNKGVWRVEDGKKFYKIVKINNWCLISFADERRFGHDILSKYCHFLVQSARKCGMELDRPRSIDIFGRNDSSEQVLRRVKKSGAEMVIVILNRRDNYHSYDEVKFLADFKFNLVTQCMEDKTLLRINDQITTNVCLKINVKLGGINHILLHRPQVFSEPVMVFGVDAIHWARGYGYPSIVSIVGSLNPTASRYALTCDLQKNEKKDKLSQEIIRDMCKLATQMLEIFRNTNGLYPRKIIVFRDGVSEGQFQHALEYEVSGIQEACHNLMHCYIPITFLVVQKRHQTRLFPANPSQGVGRNQNVPPGTSVDKDITHPVFFDFFICSHEGIQGTSKPAHYTVLHDDNKFHTEELQQLCYFLCHTYVRCTRSVSLPAPVMYADLAAARAKKYADLFTASDSASIGSEDAQRNLPPQVEEAIRSMRMYENNMFYV